MKRRIYLASSWRNEQQPDILYCLRAAGHEVYDFRNPPDRSGFQWSQVDPSWDRDSTADGRIPAGRMIELLSAETSSAGFFSDYGAMNWADTCVLLLPCGKSAHIEAGWFKGQNKDLYILMRQPEQPELMYLMADGVYTTIGDLVERLSQ